MSKPLFVLNIRHLPPVGVWTPDIRRIDRRSPYGNPFKVDDPWMTWTAVALGYRADRPGRLATALELYRAWISETPVQRGPGGPDEGGGLEFTSGRFVTMTEHVENWARVAATLYPPPTLPDRLPDLEALRGKRLACWCRPPEGFLGRLLCHGQIIAGRLYGVAPESIE